MNTKVAPADEPGIDRDLTLLEAKLAALVAHAQELRAINESLRRDLGAAQERNRALGERVASAAQQLDAVLARLPEATA